MANPTPPALTVDDPHAVGGDGHGGDGHAHMLEGYDGQMHPSNLQHHFVSAEQQFESSKLGMWLFLATEILLFGALFVAYGIFRVLYPELFDEASLQLDTTLGAANTLVLLLSSLTMAWAIRGAQMDNQKVLRYNLLATMALASAFLVVKYFEYEHKFELGIFPGYNFELDEGVDRVNDLTGSVAATPLFVPSQREDAAADAAGNQIPDETAPVSTDDAPLTGADQNPGIDGAPAAPDTGTEGGVQAEAETQAEGAQPLAGTALDEGGVAPANGATLDGAAEGGADATAAEAVLGNANSLHEDVGSMAAGGLETEHGDDSGGHGREGAIFSNRRAGIFFAIYYVMTGIHALHIIIGIVAIGFLTWFSYKGRYSSVWYTPVENVGLYWHVVDIIWIFVFPLMYLI
ncbi:cytochrome c oxidase subunit 3 [Rubrivirga sp. S365]|uniref:Cytochrome c oxidase subunit 3 n=1 Tax=Rubrivirga litoralis TaxID=3075598 RepID=A0ABU3BPW3_9BACT|nr:MULTISPECIES: cytochrome c oxidase subunit 3 [unclassified Rubrivirga]MDT0631334.1 cytochrome c oxidase subunit 3 [Rubrivirga sp. F394]MDT7855925.1 cytochrome c oxidase subunit 3 [Rubrivirga sp. S365]